MARKPRAASQRWSSAGMETPTPEPEAPKPRKALSSEEYAALRTAMEDKEFQSAPYSLVNKLSPREVNLAVTSSSYEEYIESGVAE